MVDRRHTDRRAKAGNITADRRRGERRQSPRRKSERVHVSLWVEETDGENVYLLRASDLSSEGIFFDAALPASIGSEMQLRIKLPGQDEAITAQGRVANVGRSTGRVGVGVMFTRLDGDGSERLQRFLDGRAPERR